VVTFWGRILWGELDVKMAWKTEPPEGYNPAMSLNFDKPEVARYIDEQVAAGRFPSDVALIEAAVEQMMLDDSMEITDEVADALNEAEEAIDRGEVVTLDEVKAELRTKYGCQ
jgi:Arc/MetJ-type ribon-helix-helix transcriptional regulator